MPAPPRSGLRMAMLLLAAALLCALFAALGTWQVERLGWKRGLIARVEARVHAAPVPAPGAQSWPAITRESHEYLRVQASGRYLHEKEARVQASTARGAGFWLMTPLQREDGTLLLVNRGFVPGAAPSSPASDAPVELTGLLRISEPGGGFLRDNDPAADRWFSRDVAALAAARGLPGAQVAPYFIDAEAVPNTREGEPIGGLTVIRFSDNHLVYAITWYALALMVAAGAAYVVWEARTRA